MKYRPEIDGLRAISVAVVFLFHLGNTFTPDGFVGVDAFFVISGYLITTLIYTERQGGRFSLISFYVRRIKRIAPALLTMILVVIGAGYLILDPGDYLLAARSGLYAVGGVSNFFFLANTGYFDPIAETMPLLHTWSLGVEEQFYVVWPTLFIVLWALFRKQRRAILIFVSVLSAASLATYLLTSIWDPKVAFYMPYTRAWELGLGAIIAFLPDLRSERPLHVRELLPWLGVALIAVAACQFPVGVKFISVQVLAATVGSALIIYAIEPKSVIYQLLSSRPFVFVGKISYSLYLYHFPMIVLWKHYTGARIIPIGYQPFFIVSAIVVAWLSWRLIEQPCRRAKWNWKLVLPAFLVSEIAVGCVGGLVVATDGVTSRLPYSVLPISAFTVMWEWSCPDWHPFGSYLSCTGGAPWDSAAGHAVIWGDSNAQHFMPMLDVAAREQNVSISLLGNCAAIVGTGYLTFDWAPHLKSCDEQNLAAVHVLEAADLKLIILAASWHQIINPLTPGGFPAAKAALERRLSEFAVAGRTVVILGEMPKWVTILSPASSPWKLQS